jgi:hypothetical protein
MHIGCRQKICAFHHTGANCRIDHPPAGGCQPLAGLPGETSDVYGPVRHSPEKTVESAVCLAESPSSSLHPVPPHHQKEGSEANEKAALETSHDRDMSSRCHRRPASHGAQGKLGPALHRRQYGPAPPHDARVTHGPRRSASPCCAYPTRRLLTPAVPTGTLSSCVPGRGPIGPIGFAGGRLTRAKSEMSLKASPWNGRY